MEGDSLAGAVSIQRVVSLSRCLEGREGGEACNASPGSRIKKEKQKEKGKGKEKKGAGRLERTMGRTKRTAPGDGDGSRNRGQSWSVVGGVKPDIHFQAYPAYPTRPRGPRTARGLDCSR